MAPSLNKPTSSTLSRVAKYITVRFVTLFIMVAAGVFISIVIINYGGHIDDIHRASIDEALSMLSLTMRGASLEEVAAATAQARQSMEAAFGLNQPFLLRCVRWFYQTMTFDWGVSFSYSVDRYASTNLMPVPLIILKRLPYTLLLAGATNLIVFFASIFVALNLSKNYGTWLDKLIITLSPLSSIPNWVYGILLTVIFAGQLHLLPFSGLYDTFPPATTLGYVPIILKHMILPVTAIFLGMFFSTIYTWRTFFLIHSGEDYLEIAKAKGLPERVIERRYILRPALPYIITSFTILMLTFWQGIIVLEVFFDWPGIGQMFLLAIRSNDMQITVGLVTTFAFLLGLSVFLLDIIYVLVDPRIKISTTGQTVQPAQIRRLQWLPPRQAAGWLVKHFHVLWQSVLHPDRTHPIYPAGISPPVPLHACPYLKWVQDAPPEAQGSSGRYLCHVWSHPERIGRQYISEICRSAAYPGCQRLDPSSRQSTPGVEVEISSHTRIPRRQPAGLNPVLRELLRSPEALVGLAVVLALIGISIYTVITIPYSQAIKRWSAQSMTVQDNPKNAQPTWVNWFKKDPLPPTIVQNSQDGSVSKIIVTSPTSVVNEVITYTIDYPYYAFPQDLSIVFNGHYVKKPFVDLTWLTPDGREFDLGSFSVVSQQRFVVSQDLPKKYLTGQEFQSQDTLLTGVGGHPAVQVLFRNPASLAGSAALEGKYFLRLEATLFEPVSSLDAQLVLYGQVYGLAGTDDQRRDLMVALLWGTPVALAFGFIGALSTSILSMSIAAMGSWFGGWLDSIIQRLTEVNMILPALPIAITVYYLYSKSIWMILGVIVLLNILGSSIKTYRAAFLQVKELPYIEAAKAYGASNWRLIRHYMVPRIIPLLIPQLVILVPSYVFFEATLAYLNVSDPTLPTWGKLVYDALTRGAYQGHYYWVLEPVALMVVTGLAFAVVGMSLDGILNPRLRKI